MRPILLGMNNPISARPEHALFPAPAGCTGHRIWQMLDEEFDGISKRQYCDAFDRRNLLVGEWSNRRARKTAAALRAGVMGRVVVVLGSSTWKCVGLPDETPLLGSERDLLGTAWHRAPHPSGRNHWFNERPNRRAFARLLMRLAREE